MSRVEIVITSRNRKDDLRRALRSCISQDYPALDISVYDDCSDDGTLEMIQREFPTVLPHASAERVGYIVLRNRAYLETRASYIVSLDDDAWFTDRGTVRVVVAQMQSDPTLAALAIPYLERAQPGQSASSAVPGTELKSYVGTAHICRVAAVRKVSGYRALLVHQGEERDLCTRLRVTGWSIRMADAPPIVHAVSPTRDLRRMHLYAVRNQLLYDFFYAPATVLPFIAAIHVIRLATYVRSTKWMLQTLRYALLALGDCWNYRQHRTPLGFSVYKSQITLPAHGPSYVHSSQLPPPCEPVSLTA